MKKLSFATIEERKKEGLMGMVEIGEKYRRWRMGLRKNIQFHIQKLPLDHIQFQSKYYKIIQFIFYTTCIL